MKEERKNDKVVVSLYYDILQLKGLTVDEKVVLSYVHTGAVFNWNLKFDVTKLHQKLNINERKLQTAYTKLFDKEFIFVKPNGCVTTNNIDVQANQFLALTNSIVQSELTFNSKIILSYIQSITNYYGKFIVKDETIGKKLGITVPTIKKRLAKLIDDGYIRETYEKSTRCLTIDQEVLDAYLELYDSEVETNVGTLNDLIKSLQPTKVKKSMKEYMDSFTPSEPKPDPIVINPYKSMSDSELANEIKHMTDELTIRLATRPKEVFCNQVEFNNDWQLDINPI